VCTIISKMVATSLYVLVATALQGGEGDPKEHEGMSEGKDGASQLPKTAG
jgi:hypothetical protein